MAVDVVRGVVIVGSDSDYKLYVYSLADGSLLRSFGEKGSGKGQFHWGYGGMCMTPRGTLLLAEQPNNRLQELSVDDGSHVRFIIGSAKQADYVDCSNAAVAVSEYTLHRVTLMSWPDCRPLCHFGSQGSGDGQLSCPYGLRLLADGSGVVVADEKNDRLCVFSMAGAFVRSVPAGSRPRDVVECDGGASFVVVSSDADKMAKVSASAGSVASFGSFGSGLGQFNTPSALAVVASVGSGVQLVVLEAGGRRFQVFRC